LLSAAGGYMKSNFQFFPSCCVALAPLKLGVQVHMLSILSQLLYEEDTTESASSSFCSFQFFPSCILL
ncbi:MAG: hypothetical protein NZ954_09050, partial [Thermofilaceae archaeon]|nr:hypothetical protein [Thermofilaceae archaeon]